MRVNHAAVLIGDQIYSFGGYCSTDDYKDWQPIPVHVLNTNTMRWTNLDYKVDGDTVPFERYGHSAVAYGDKVREIIDAPLKYVVSEYCGISL